MIWYLEYITFSRFPDQQSFKWKNVATLYNNKGEKSHFEKEILYETDSKIVLTTDKTTPNLIYCRQVRNMEPFSDSVLYRIAS